MQHQVMKRNMPSDLGWGNGPEGGCNPQNFASGSGSWTSTANQDSVNSSSSMWQGMGKSDSASDTGDDASSGKSGSTICSVNNTTSQSQDTSSISSTSVTPTSSSSLWNTSSATLSGLDASPWGSSNSPAPSGVGPVGWSSNPSSLSLSSGQGHNNMQAGSNIIGGSVGSASSSTGWSPSVSGSGLTNNQGLSSGSGMQPNTLSSQWQSGSTLLGNIGDFVKTSDSGWTNPTSSLLDSSKDGAGGVADMRMWGLSADRSGDSQWATAKSQWGNAGSVAGSEHGGSNAELSFAQATQKGLKIQPPANGPQTPLTSRQEEILRAIESHEGWGSRPIRQDTSWDVEISPKSLRKFSTANNEAANVWNNSNGTAIWEAFRENQRSNLTGGAPAANSYIAEKDQPNWAGAARMQQDPNTWNIGNNANGKDFGTWGVTAGAGDASNKMWGQKTEVGSWDDTGVQRTTSMSSWGDDGDAGSWEDQRRMTSGMGNMQVMPPSPGMGVSAGMGPRSVGGVGMIASGVDATPWNDGQKQGWNSANAAVVTRTNVDEPWNKPPPTRSGWGETAHDATDVDNGTGLWASSVPKQCIPLSQGKVPSWTDSSPQGQWNAAVGAKPKIPAGWDETSWNLAQRAKMPQKFVSNGSNPPTQMRAKLLQHLLDMGFPKEQAQAALITNNLNLVGAINDLKAGNVNVSRKDLDMDVFQPNGSQSHMPYMSKGGIGSDNMSDVRLDQVPNFNNMQNTPFPNAQISNQSFVQSNASLPPSSLNLNNSSITPNLQQKLMQKIQQQQPPPSAALSQRAMPAASSQVPPQQQQQILAQLRQAVSNGFISPQLINYQLPHNILVLLQQLLQLQSALQNVMSKQQQLIQQARATGNPSNPQLEQMSGIINNINQQIINVQKQLQQAQNALFSSQKPPVASQPPSNTLTAQSGVNIMDSLDALSNDLAIVALQNQSRLSTQWKSDMSSSARADGTNSSTLPMGAAVKTTDNSGDNKIPGVKGTLQSSSSSNLNLIPGGLGMTGDKTWSSNLSATSTSSWPLSTDSLSTNSQTDQKASNSTNMSTSLLSSLSSGVADVIPEFIPGKPWQGFTKNVEDDLHVTPASIQFQRSLSVNRVHEESLNHLDGNKFSGSSWSTGLKNDNSLGLSQLGSHPPPAMAASKGMGGQQWSTGGFNRQTSWPHSGTSAFTKVAGPGWNESNVAPSSWLLLKNLTVDGSTVRALSAQHGTLVSFYPLAQGQFALVQYANREMAFVAQQRLNNFQMGSTVITAEFISEADAQRVAAQIPPPPPPPQASSIPPVNNSLWSQAPPSTPFQNAGMRSGDPWSTSTSHHSSKYGSGGDNYWGLWDRPEHNPNPLSNILGGESM
ncbi:unnamed protein product [Candidula unifasciata]|uniref:UBA domain-containing protein n=1 Tax=Candidula unifasciata TaxID=100452 RepID=A0A8S3YN79_9EUPU|nr:unnamed protein product [Candidula unifasciata]